MMKTLSGTRADSLLFNALSILRVCSIALLTLLALPTAADSPELEQLASLYGVDPSREMVAISPNGELLAFRTRDGDKDLILVHSLKEGKNITGAHVGEMDPRRLHFVSDQYLIMVASKETRLMGFRGRNEISTAYALNVETGDIEQLLRPGHVIYAGQQGLGRILGISDDGRKLYMPAYVPRSKTDRQPDYALLEVDIEKPRNPKVLEDGHSYTVDWFVGRNGKVLAQERYNEDDYQHEILVRDGDDWRVIYSDNSPRTVASFIGETPDQQSLVMLKEDWDTGRLEYYRLNLNSGKQERLDLNRNDSDIANVRLNAERVAIGITYAGFNPSYHFFDAVLNDRVSKLQAQFKGHSLYVVNADSELNNLVLYLEGPSTTGEFYLSQKNQPVRFLLSAYPGISEAEVQPSVPFEFKARDGLVIPTLLTIPRVHAANPENLPAVVLPHGGPESYDRQEFDALVQSIAARGYAVIQPQFRGSYGFGYEHWAAGLGEWGRAMQDDVSDAVKALSNVGFIDPDRVCIAGASYGGYSALAGAAFTPDLYRCAISIHGVSDLNAMLEHEEKDLGEDHWVIEYFSRSIAKNYFTPERLAAHSPANFASGISAPVLLVHGEEDEIVPIEQSELMLEKLQAANKPVKYLPLKDTGHSYGEEPVRQMLIEEVLAFLDEHLAPSGQTLATTNSEAD